ncbi:MAG TPA: hypothetical protein DDW18_04520 [Firmicutes bacterium]|nr:hypothetical protein [Bacillota bacterium]HBM99644.1 hypothetical protein [Bacillota bacterium]
MDQLKENEAEISEKNKLTSIPSLEEADVSSAASSEKENKKRKSAWFQKKNVLFWGVGGTISLALGIGAGFVLGTVFNAGGIGDYNNVNASLYAVDYDELIKKYYSVKSLDYSKEFTPCEMANLSLGLMYKSDSWKAQGYGKTSFNVFGVSGDQQIRSTFMKVGDEYFEESLSKSDLVQAAWRMYEKYDSGDNSVVKRYPGKVSKDVYDSHFNEAEMVEYSREDYKTLSGRYLDGVPCIYLISDKCLSKDDQEVTSNIPTKVEKTSSGYTIEIELDPKITVKNYVVQMQATADLAGPPSFKFVHLTFKTDAKLNLISMSNYEKYYAKTSSGAGSNMTAKITTYFETNGDFSIPRIDEQTKYDASKEN